MSVWLTLSSSGGKRKSVMWFLFIKNIYLCTAYIEMLCRTTIFGTRASATSPLLLLHTSYALWDLFVWKLFPNLCPSKLLLLERHSIIREATMRGGIITHWEKKVAAHKDSSVVQEFHESRTHTNEGHSLEVGRLGLDRDLRHRTVGRISILAPWNFLPRQGMSFCHG